MSSSIQAAAIHHLALTVTDVERSRAFYSDVLGFQEVAPLPTGVLLGNGALLIGIRTAPDPSRAGREDRFDENRVGMDHVSFGVGSRADIERAIEVLDRYGVAHGEISDAPDLGMTNLFFRDPDNIQLELTAPVS